MATARVKAAICTQWLTRTDPLGIVRFDSGRGAMMSHDITADDGSIELEHNGRTLTVPRTFKKTELAAWYGGVPDEIRVDRIFVYDGVVRAEQQDSPWVEVGHFTEDDFRPGNETGWVAEKLDIAADTDTNDGPGETLWVRDD